MSLHSSLEHILRLNIKYFVRHSPIQLAAGFYLNFIFKMKCLSGDKIIKRFHSLLSYINTQSSQLHSIRSRVNFLFIYKPNPIKPIQYLDSYLKQCAVENIFTSLMSLNFQFRLLFKEKFSLGFPSIKKANV